MPLLAIENLTVQFPSRRGVFTAVDNVSLKVEAGEILGVVGESGAGKSTVGNAVIGLLEPPGHIAGGTIRLKGERIDNLPYEGIRRIRGRRIGMIFQDPLTSLNPLYTIERQLVETIGTHFDLPEKACRDRAVDWLDQVGIADARERIRQNPHQFSGGMRQRVVIALALCGEPELIIADEPTTALDVSIQAQILEVIKGLCKKHNVGVILITHDMGVIANTTDRIAVMYRGRLVETGSTEKVLGGADHPYTRSLISAVPRPDKKLKRFPLITYIEGPEPATTSMKHHSDWFTRSTRFEQAAGELLKLENVTMRFVTRWSLVPARRRLLEAVKSVSLSIREGEVFGLVGESGSGKSTIARMITGICRASSGVISFAGTDLLQVKSEKDLRPLRRQMQMIFQDPYSSLNPRMRVLDIVAEPIRFHDLADSETEVRKTVHELLDIVELGSAAAVKFPHEFSGGQRQRVSIARALATHPRFLICDEPTSALDVSIQAQILNLLKDLQEEFGLTMLFISHDLPVIRQMCDRVAVMRLGQLCEVADTEQLFTNPQHKYTQHLLSLMPRLRTAEQ